MGQACHSPALLAASFQRSVCLARGVFPFRLALARLFFCHRALAEPFSADAIAVISALRKDTRLRVSKPRRLICCCSFSPSSTFLPCLASHITEPRLPAVQGSSASQLDLAQPNSEAAFDRVWLAAFTGLLSSVTVLIRLRQQPQGFCRRKDGSAFTSTSRTSRTWRR